MEFDESRVYTAVNADKLKIGSNVIVADSLFELKHCVETESMIYCLTDIKEEFVEYRFIADDTNWALAYLVSEPEEKKLKFTGLKVGDVITDGEMECMVVTIDKSKDAFFRICVICSGGSDWLGDDDLKNWKKVEE